MQLKHSKLAFAALWVLAISAVGLVANVTSVSGWIVLAALALIPAIVGMKLWKDPPQTMSESIRKALR